MAASMQMLHLRSSSFRGAALSVRAPAAVSTPAAAAMAPVRAAQSIQGTVVSTGMNKTVVVAVNRLVVHPVYLKRTKRTHKFFAHDEAEEASVGDVVVLAPCRPLSKNKKFTLESIVTKAK